MGESANQQFYKQKSQAPAPSQKNISQAKRWDCTDNIYHLAWDKLSNFPYLKPYCEAGKHILERKLHLRGLNIAFNPLHESTSSAALIQKLIVNPELC